LLRKKTVCLDNRLNPADNMKALLQHYLTVLTPYAETTVRYYFITLCFD